MTIEATPQTHYVPSEDELAHHGDRDTGAGLIDLAVNVRHDAPPPWLLERIAAVDLRRYPDPSAGCEAVAARHGRKRDEALLTAGAAEAFELVARAFTPRHAVVVHPQFTEPERALRRAGHDVHRVVLQPPFQLQPADVPDAADLVLVGNPTNPTSVLHPAALLAELARPGRIVVVDEAFADAVPGEVQSLAGRRDIPGLLVVRSLTKTWGLAGLRVGYLLGPADLVARLSAAQPPWAVSAPAVAACVACSEPAALHDAARWAHNLSAERSWLAARLAALQGVTVVPGAAGPFLLLRVPDAGVHQALRARGWAVRSGAGFPGLGPRWIRVAVRDRPVNDEFATALEGCL